MTEQGIQFAEQGTYKVAQGIREGARYSISDSGAPRAGLAEPRADPKQKSVHFPRCVSICTTVRAQKNQIPECPLQRRLKGAPTAGSHVPGWRTRHSKVARAADLDPSKIMRSLQHHKTPSTGIIPFKKQLTLKFSRSLENVTCEAIP